MAMRCAWGKEIVFTLQSIKSRIETDENANPLPVFLLFLLYSPLNQGLKLNVFLSFLYLPYRFYSTVH